MADIDWEATARKAGWDLGSEEPHGAVLIHKEQDRIWPPGDWEGAARDLGIDPDDVSYRDDIILSPIGLEKLGEMIIKELSDSRIKTQKYFAERYGVLYCGGDEILDDFRNFLKDPSVTGQQITKLANELLPDYTVDYEGDDVVTLTKLYDDDYGFRP